MGKLNSPFIWYRQWSRSLYVSCVISCLYWRSFRVDVFIVLRYCLMKHFACVHNPSSPLVLFLLISSDHVTHVALFPKAVFSVLFAFWLYMVISGILFYYVIQLLNSRRDSEIYYSNFDLSSIFLLTDSTKHISNLNLLKPETILLSQCSYLNLLLVSHLTPWL